MHYLIIPITLALFARDALGQTPHRSAFPEIRAVTISVAKGNFTDAVGQLADALHCSIVADGAPFREPGKYAFSGPPDAVLSALCASVHYSWRVTPTGAVLMEKAFDIVGDIPQAPLDEVTSVANDVLRTIVSLPAQVTVNDHMTNFDALGASLSDLQRSILLSGRHIPVSLLDPAQRRVALGLILDTVCSETQAGFLQLQRALKTLAISYLVKLQAKLREPGGSEDLVTDLLLATKNGDQLTPWLTIAATQTPSGPGE